jgi:hypothetical protein
MVQSLDIRRMQEENPFMWSKFEAVADRFLSQFHKDYYESVCMKDGIHGLTTPIIHHKSPTLSSLQGHHHLEVDALTAKLEWRILQLMTFKHS